MGHDVEPAAAEDADLRTELILQMELPALGSAVHLSFAVRPSRTHSILESLQDIANVIMSEWSSDLLGADYEGTMEKLEHLRQRARADLGAWNDKLRRANDWKRKHDYTVSKMSKMTDAYCREVSHLREQIYQKKKADQSNTAFQPDAAVHFDASEFTMDDDARAWANEQLRALKQEQAAEVTRLKVRHSEKVSALSAKLSTAEELLTRRERLFQRMKTKLQVDEEGDEACPQEGEGGSAPGRDGEQEGTAEQLDAEEKGLEEKLEQLLERGVENGAPRGAGAEESHHRAHQAVAEGSPEIERGVLEVETEGLSGRDFSFRGLDLLGHPPGGPAAEAGAHADPQRMPGGAVDPPGLPQCADELGETAQTCGQPQGGATSNILGLLNTATKKTSSHRSLPKQYRKYCTSDAVGIRDELVCGEATRDSARPRVLGRRQHTQPVGAAGNDEGQADAEACGEGRSTASTTATKPRMERGSTFASSIGSCSFVSGFGTTEQGTDAHEEPSVRAEQVDCACQSDIDAQLLQKAMEFFRMETEANWKQLLTWGSEGSERTAGDTEGDGPGGACERTVRAAARGGAGGTCERPAGDAAGDSAGGACERTARAAAGGGAGGTCERPAGDAAGDSAGGACGAGDAGAADADGASGDGAGETHSAEEAPDAPRVSEPPCLPPVEAPCGSQPADTCRSLLAGRVQSTSWRPMGGVDRAILHKARRRSLESSLVPDQELPRESGAEQSQESPDEAAPSPGWSGMLQEPAFTSLGVPVERDSGGTSDRRGPATSPAFTLKKLARRVKPGLLKPARASFDAGAAERPSLHDRRSFASEDSACPDLCGLLVSGINGHRPPEADGPGCSPRRRPNSRANDDDYDPQLMLLESSMGCGAVGRLPTISHGEAGEKDAGASTVEPVSPTLSEMSSGRRSLVERHRRHSSGSAAFPDDGRNTMPVTLSLPDEAGSALRVHPPRPGAAAAWAPFDLRKVPAAPRGEARGPGLRNLAPKSSERFNTTGSMPTAGDDPAGSGSPNPAASPRCSGVKSSLAPKSSERFNTTGSAPAAGDDPAGGGDQSLASPRCSGAKSSWAPKSGERFNTTGSMPAAVDEPSLSPASPSAAGTTPRGPGARCAAAKNALRFISSGATPSPTAGEEPAGLGSLNVPHLQQQRHSLGNCQTSVHPTRRASWDSNRLSWRMV